MGPKAAQTKSRTQKPLINIARLRPSADAYAEKTELVLDSVLEKIFSGFTIERERDVFRNIFPAQSIAANSASQTETGATLDEFFF